MPRLIVKSSSKRPPDVSARSRFTAGLVYLLESSRALGMSILRSIPDVRRWTAAELRRLPPEQRDAILEAAATAAQRDYETDPNLKGFDAFGDKDLHADSSRSTTR